MLNKSLIVIAFIMLIYVSIGAHLQICNTNCFVDNEVDSLIHAIKSHDVDVQKQGFVASHLLSPLGSRAITIEGESVIIFVYYSQEQAGEDTSRLSPDGFGYSARGSLFFGSYISISWVDEPHFFKADKYVVLYVGSNSTITNLLTSAIGPQFIPSLN